MGFLKLLNSIFEREWNENEGEPVAWREGVVVAHGCEGNAFNWAIGEVNKNNFTT